MLLVTVRVRSLCRLPAVEERSDEGNEVKGPHLEPRAGLIMRTYSPDLVCRSRHPYWSRSMVRNTLRRATSFVVCALALAAPTAIAQRGGGAGAADSIKYKYPSTAQIDALKAEAVKEIDAKAKMIQVMVDQVFSYGELGFQ